MTEPSQYFKGRTVQEQMDEVIGYVDKRAEEVAAAKADAVLQPAEQAKTAAQAAAEAAEAAKDTTLAALPEIRQDISGLKAEDVALDGRLDTVELKVQTAEGNIVTIQGQIVALQNVQGDYVKKNGAAQTVTSQIMVPTTATGTRDTQVVNGTRVQNDLDAYEPVIRTTGNQRKDGIFTIPKLVTGNLGCTIPFNLTDGVRSVARISSYGIEKYNDIHLLICERSTAYYAHIYSGSSAAVSAIDLINITSLSAVTPGSVDFKMGCVTREDGQHLVVEHLGGANRIFSVIILCASRGGSTVLVLEPDNEVIDTSVDTIVYYTNQGE